MALNLDDLLAISFLVLPITFGILSAYDFHTPYSAQQVRYSTVRGRYILSLSVFIATSVFTYIVLQWLLFRILNGAFADAPKYEPLKISFISNALTIAVLIATRQLPWTSRIISQFRETMQSLARYPQSAIALTAALLASPLLRDDAARKEFKDILKRYGIGEQTLEQVLDGTGNILSLSVIGLAEDIISLRRQLQEKRKNQDFANFFLARKGPIERLEAQYQRLMVHLARAILMVCDIGELARSANGDALQLAADLPMDISELVAEEADTVRAGYARVFADMSLSSFWLTAGRQDFLKRSGFEALPLWMPMAPLVLVFLSALVAAILPGLLIPVREADRMHNFSPWVVGIANALSLTVAVMLAFSPKQTSRFARPSLYSLPWLSYAIFGAASYGIGFAVMGIALYAEHNSLPEGFLAHSHPITAAAIISLLFLSTNICIGVLLDMRLRRSRPEPSLAKLWDALILMIVMTASFRIVLLLINLAREFFYGTVMALPWPVYYTLPFYGCLGLVIGWVIPSAAETYMGLGKAGTALSQNAGKVLS